MERGVEDVAPYKYAAKHFSSARIEPKINPPSDFPEGGYLLFIQYSFFFIL